MNTLNSKPGHPKTRVALWVGLILVAFLAGYYISKGPTPPPPSVEPSAKAGSTDTQSSSNEKKSGHDHEATIWTCAMHPQIRMSGPGKCPICYMDLIPVEESGTDTSVSRDMSKVTLSDYAKNSQKFKPPK